MIDTELIELSKVFDILAIEYPRLFLTSVTHASNEVERRIKELD